MAVIMSLSACVLLCVVLAAYFVSHPATRTTEAVAAHSGIESEVELSVEPTEVVGQVLFIERLRWRTYRLDCLLWPPTRWPRRPPAGTPVALVVVVSPWHPARHPALTGRRLTVKMSPRIYIALRQRHSTARMLSVRGFDALDLASGQSALIHKRVFSDQPTAD